MIRTTLLATAALLAIPVLIAVLAIAALRTAALGAGPGGSSASAAALADIPAPYLALYQQAAAVCPGLGWSVLAAVGKVETDHGRSTLPGTHEGQNASGAGGPMQILQPTWDEILDRHEIPPGGGRPPSRYNPHDAIHAAAFYLCDNGAPTNLQQAVFAYNRADWYVEKVLAQAADYRQSTPTTSGWAPEHAAVADPTGTGGAITPRMSALYHAVQASGITVRGATCWDPHPQNPASDHPRGKACDIFLDPHNPDDVNRGWQLAGWLTTTQTTYGIHYLIWQGQFWSAESPTWRPYRSDIYRCPNPANLTGCHYDHIHISVY